VSELGNLTGGILLPSYRMSTVKIRARSLFRTPGPRIEAEGAAFGAGGCQFSSSLHNRRGAFTGCAQKPAL
jgi:hypothetical protein